VKRRYLLRAAGLSFNIGGRKVGGAEMWIGLEIESDTPIDLHRISERTGWHLIPADGMSDDELRSAGITEWEPIRF
jgi:hypothetical protein